MRFLFLLAILVLISARANAEPPRPLAPSLTPVLLHQRVQDELDRAMRELPAAVQQRLAGTYVAFDADQTNAFAMISCDDDGDHVVVMSDAMIEFAQRVAEASSDDATQGTQKLSAYASTIASQSNASARLLPPPPGFYEGTHDAAREGELFDQAMHGIVAHELARLARGHLVCPRPSSAHESGDDIWTTTERAYAFKLAEKLYDADHLRDADAISLPSMKGKSTGFVALLDALAIVEAGQGKNVAYVRLHPGSQARAQALRAAETAQK